MNVNVKFLKHIDGWPQERDYTFCRFLTFLQVIVRKKSLVLVVVGVGMKKRMKQNAETAESKSFIAFV